MSIWSLNYQQSVFKSYHGDRYFSELYLQDGGKKSTGIDIKKSLSPYVLRGVLYNTRSRTVLGRIACII